MHSRMRSSYDRACTPYHARWPRESPSIRSPPTELYGIRRSMSEPRSSQMVFRAIQGRIWLLVSRHHESDFVLIPNSRGSLPLRPPSQIAGLTTSLSASGSSHPRGSLLWVFSTLPNTFPTWSDYWGPQTFICGHSCGELSEFIFLQHRYFVCIVSNSVKKTKA